MNTAATQAARDRTNRADRTITLNEGFLARRNALDWVFAALVAAGGLFALQRYGAFMDVYEKASCSAPFPAPCGWAGSGGRCGC